MKMCQAEEAEVPLQETGGTPSSPNSEDRVQPLVEHLWPLLQRQHPGASYRDYQGEVGQRRKKDGAPPEVLQT